MLNLPISSEFCVRFARMVFGKKLLDYDANKLSRLKGYIRIGNSHENLK